jgi:hypothetical protein
MQLKFPWKQIEIHVPRLQDVMIMQTPPPVQEKRFSFVPPSKQKVYETTVLFQQKLYETMHHLSSDIRITTVEANIL